MVLKLYWVLRQQVSLYGQTAWKPHKVYYNSAIIHWHYRWILVFRCFMNTVQEMEMMMCLYFFVSWSISLQCRVCSKQTDGVQKWVMLLNSVTCRQRSYDPGGEKKKHLEPSTHLFISLLLRLFRLILFSRLSSFIMPDFLTFRYWKSGPIPASCVCFRDKL